MESSATHTADADHDDGGGHTHGSTESNPKLALVAGINLVGFLAELADRGVDHATVELCPPDAGQGPHLDAHVH